MAACHFWTVWDNNIEYLLAELKRNKYYTILIQLFELNTKKGQNYYITQIQQCDKNAFQKKNLPTYPIF